MTLYGNTIAVTVYRVWCTTNRTTNPVCPDMVGLNNFSKENVELGMGLVTANWDHHAHTPVAFTYMKVLKIMQPPIWLRKEREKDTHTHSLIHLDVLKRLDGCNFM
jgi:hypothetical protein